MNNNNTITSMAQLRAIAPRTPDKVRSPLSIRRSAVKMSPKHMRTVVNAAYNKDNECALIRRLQNNNNK